ncbi:putative leucine-rich repeat-containing protein DDB_G0290503 [Mya arenaria]|uniref:putative leucine-rich repeat-containing protein DDB_G0290503 n=1 Tax=Mya arenaria TaxID=6604 RepID=UPI0022E215CD|nr:putative leucine-rich repeat-containing protein DDB_G0290503 [Mya arenaria]
MADKADTDKKRKPSKQSISEPSEIETSVTEDKSPDTKKKKQKKKKTKHTDIEAVMEDDEYELEKSNEKEIAGIKKQLKEITSKLNNMVSKIDKSTSTLEKKLEQVIDKDSEGMNIREIIKEMFTDMKESLLGSAILRIEKLECQQFDRESDKDKHSKKIEQLEKHIKDRDQEIHALKRDVIENETKREYSQNDFEQYTRLNNIRIRGLPENDENPRAEKAEETTEKVVKLLSERKINVVYDDIDISHRLWKTVRGKRDVIVRFKSRMKRDSVMRNKRSLRGSGIWLFDDLTKLNHEVFMSVRHKMKDEVDQAWISNGKILYRDKSGKVIRVDYDDYDSWLDLPWPNT